MRRLAKIRVVEGFRMRGAGLAAFQVPRAHDQKMIDGRAFLLPMGAPDPFAPPCIRRRAFHPTASAWQGVPLRVRAPQRVLSCIGPVLRG